MYFTRLIAALFVIAKICKNFVAPHLENEFRKIWFIYTMEYCSTINSKDIMNCANKWMDLENIILAFSIPVLWVFHLQDSISLCLLYCF